MPFDSDQPIQSKDEDKLGRRGFAESIAGQIGTIPVAQGFTAAIVGEWGSGKSSLLNMVRESLEEGNDTTIVLQFNPWLFGGAEDLLPRFFSELGAQLGQSKSIGIRQVARALSEFGTLAAPFIPLPLGELTTKAAATAVSRLAQPRSLISQRDILRNTLLRLEGRIVVIIDDLDRLQRNEARELVRLIRLTSDLPNLVFLLAFDEERLANSLEGPEGVGYEYLNKIVQMEFDVPVVRKKILHQMLSDGLDQAIQNHRLMQLDTEEWGRVLLGIVDPLLDTVRDVKRYVNSIPTTLESVGKEVALADLLGVEALRILRSSIFDRLKARRELLTFPGRESSQRLRLEQRGVNIGEEIGTMLNQAAGDRELLDAVLQILFPATQEYMRGMSFGTSQIQEWRKRRRISTEEIFGIYLHAGLDADSVPEDEIRRLVEAMSDGNRFASLLDSLSDERLDSIIDRFLDFGENFGGEVRPEAVTALVNQLYKLSPDAGGMFLMAPRSKARQIIYRLLRRIQSLGDLDSALPGIIQSIDSMSGKFSVLEMVAHREAVDRQLINEGLASAIIDQIIEGLEKATAQDLAKEWDLFEMILRLGMRLTADQRSRLNARMKEHLADDSFTVRLLRTAENTAYLNGRPQRRLFWDGLLELFGDDLLVAVQQLARSEQFRHIGARDRAAVELALNYASGVRPDASDVE